MNKDVMSKEFMEDLQHGLHVLVERVKHAESRVDAIEKDRENLKKRVVELTKENAMLIEIVKNLSSRAELKPDTFKFPPVQWPTTTPSAPTPPYTPTTPVNPSWPHPDWLDRNKFVD